MVAINEFFSGIKFYYVGGCVRDLVMGFEPKDYDLTTPHLPDEVEQYIKLKGKKPFLIGKKFGTIGVKIQGQIVEITTFRKEDYKPKDRKPVVQYTKHLTEDLQRRDFTINAMVICSKGIVRDYFGGIEDIKNKTLRTVGNPKERFKEDPLRILRALRFACKYELDFDNKTYEKMYHCRWEMLNLSKERIVDEITKILQIGNIRIAHLFLINLIQPLIPELHLQKDYSQNTPHHSYTLDMHTSFVVRNVAKDYQEKKYLWAALLHDVAKPFVAELHKSGERTNYINHDLLGSHMANSICKELKFSNEDREFIVNTVANHLNQDCWLKKYDMSSKIGGGKE